jgi:hypothetical protein
MKPEFRQTLKRVRYPRLKGEAAALGFRNLKLSPYGKTSIRLAIKVGGFLKQVIWEPADRSLQINTIRKGDKRDVD